MELVPSPTRRLVGQPELVHSSGSAKTTKSSSHRQFCSRTPRPPSFFPAPALLPLPFLYQPTNPSILSNPSPRFHSTLLFHHSLTRQLGSGQFGPFGLNAATELIFLKRQTLTVILSSLNQLEIDLHPLSYSDFRHPTLSSAEMTSGKGTPNGGAVTPTEDKGTRKNSTEANP